MGPNITFEDVQLARGEEHIAELKLQYLQQVRLNIENEYLKTHKKYELGDKVTVKNIDGVFTVWTASIADNGNIIYILNCDGIKRWAVQDDLILEEK